jgi:photosystem II stability/assembly factor-like uncharacterized protein
MGRLLRCWVVVPLLATPAIVVDAQDWVPIGPPGGVMDNVAVDPDAPDTVYATGIGRLYRSADGGRHWQQPPVVDAHSIAVGTGGRVYVGGYLSSKSSDGGSTWNAIDALHERGVYAMAVDPAQPQVVYALADAGSGPLQLLTSSDGAATFAPCCGLLPETAFVPPRLAVDPVAPGTLYALIPSRGVFKSVDGEDWLPTGDGLPRGCGIAYRIGSETAPVEHDCLLSLVVDPHGTLYVGTDGHGIYRSTDEGDTWSALGGALAERAVSAIAVAASDTHRLFAGITAVHDPSTGETIDAPGGAVFRSNDGGAFWSDVSDGLSRASANGLAINPEDADQVNVATGGVGVVFSRDGGATWRHAGEGLNASCLVSMASAATTSTTLLTSDAAELPRIFSSADGGEHWGDTALERRSLGVFSFAVDASEPSTIYTSDLDNAVLKSTDGGRTWSRRSTGFDGIVEDLALDPGTATTLYAAAGVSGVIKSTDGSATWTPVNSGLPPIRQVAVDAATGTVYATAEGVAFESPDSGATWNSISSIPQPFQSLLLVAPTTPATLFATTSDNVYASRNGGDSWQVVQLPGTTFELGALRLAVSPANAKTVYAMQARQLLRSDDQGQSWRTVGGLLDEPLNAIAVDANMPETIYAATCGGGVFALHQTQQATAGSGGDGCSIGSPQQFTARTFLAHVFVIALLLARRTTRNGVRRRL